jgi:DNA-binding MarR family transcriptional regulator
MAAPLGGGKSRAAASQDRPTPTSRASRGASGADESDFDVAAGRVRIGADLVGLGDQAIGELGAPLFLDSGALSPLLKRLRAAGYVSRSPDPKDERVTRIALTPEGAALKTKARGVPVAMARAARLDLAELGTLRDSLQRLGRSLRAAG